MVFKKKRLQILHSNHTWSNKVLKAIILFVLHFENAGFLKYLRWSQVVLFIANNDNSFSVNENLKI